MKKLLILGIFLTGSYSACYGEETPKETSPEISQVGIGVEVDAGDDDGYYDDDGEDQIIWIGPGLYYGLWFDEEWEYNDWWGNNGWGHGHHGHGHGHGHDHGHGGGHHHGGGHGGGHHGGGHHGGGHGGGHHH